MALFVSQRNTHESHVTVIPPNNKNPKMECQGQASLTQSAKQETPNKSLSFPSRSDLCSPCTSTSISNTRRERERESEREEPFSDDVYRKQDEGGNGLPVDDEYHGAHAVGEGCLGREGHGGVDALDGHHGQSGLVLLEERVSHGSTSRKEEEEELMDLQASRGRRAV